MYIHPIIYSGLRVLMQAFWGVLVGLLLKVGVVLPDFVGSWIVESILVAGVIGLTTVVIRWLESQKGDSLFARLARAAAKWIMAGLAKPPVYPVDPPPTSAQPAAIKYDDGRVRPVL